MKDTNMQGKGERYKGKGIDGACGAAFFIKDAPERRGHSLVSCPLHLVSGLSSLPFSLLSDL
jgi:hypothetical protein